MPQRINPKKSDLSVSLGTKLRLLLVAACKEDETSLSQATKEAVSRWLASRERKMQRSKGKEGRRKDAGD
jgi:hypothetical protein